MGLKTVFIAIMIVFSSSFCNEPYPIKNITIVSSYNTGGASDIAARLIASVAPPFVGTNITVKNIVGNGGLKGSNSVHKAAPDGYTLLLGRFGSITGPAAAGKPMPYAYDDFTMLGLIEINPMVCATSSQSPYNSIGKLIKAIKENPDAISYSSVGFGTTQHLTPLMLLHLSGIKNISTINKRVYSSGFKAAEAVVNGEVDFTCNPLSALQGFVIEGKLKPLLVNTPTPYSKLPGTPTAANLGFKELEAIVGWSALFAPPGLPQDIISHWTTVLLSINEDNRWRQLVSSTGSIPTILPPKQTREFVEKQLQIQKKLLDKLGVHYK